MGPCTTLEKGIEETTMKYINQKHEKDCLQATLANLLGISYNTIPDFWKYYNGEDNGEFTIILDDFLADMGCFRFLVDVTYEDNKIKLPFYFSSPTITGIGILKKKDRWWSHAVLMEISRNQDKFSVTILHDPKPNSEYTIEDIIQVEIIIKWEGVFDGHKR